MRKFKDFIDSIIGDMKIDNTRRNDLSDEFMDHLEMLKQEYIDTGLSEEEAENQAIKSFGDTKILRHGLHDSLFSYRTIFNTLFGLLLLITAYRLGSHIPVPGMNPNDLTLNITAFKYLAIGLIPMFFFMGYFLPIILNRKNAIQYVVIFSLFLSTVLIAWFELSINKIVGEYSYRLTDIIYFAGIVLMNIIESILGYGMLKLTHQVSQVIKKNVWTS